MQLRITPQTSQQFASARALFDQIGRALAGGVTTTDALTRADGELAKLIAEARLLRISVRQEIALTQRREREDRKVQPIQLRS